MPDGADGRPAVPRTRPRTSDFATARAAVQELERRFGTRSGSLAPLNPMRLLWINLISDAVPAMALALEPGGGDDSPGRA